MTTGGINMGTLFKTSMLGPCATILSTTWSISASSLKEGPTKENAILSSILSSTTSSMTCVSDESITTNIAKQYIESLSEAQLVELSERIEAKEKNFVVETNTKDGNVVVKVKTDNCKRI